MKHSKLIQMHEKLSTFLTLRIHNLTDEKVARFENTDKRAHAQA